MNILEQEDVVKGLPDQVLIQYAQDPTGEIPQFLAVSEIQRREKMRKSFNERVPEETVTEQVISQGIAAMNPNPDPLMATAMGAQPPQDPMMGQQMQQQMQQQIAGQDPMMQPPMMGQDPMMMTPQDPMMQPPMDQQMMPPQDPMMMAAGGGMMPYRMQAGRGTSQALERALAAGLSQENLNALLGEVANMRNMTPERYSELLSIAQSGGFDVSEFAGLLDPAPDYSGEREPASYIPYGSEFNEDPVDFSLPGSDNPVMQQFLGVNTDNQLGPRVDELISSVDLSEQAPPVANEFLPARGSSVIPMATASQNNSNAALDAMVDTMNRRQELLDKYASNAIKEDTGRVTPEDQTKELVEMANAPNSKGQREVEVRRRGEDPSPEDILAEIEKLKGEAGAMDREAFLAEAGVPPLEDQSLTERAIAQVQPGIDALSLSNPVTQSLVAGISGGRRGEGFGGLAGGTAIERWKDIAGEAYQGLRGAATINKESLELAQAMRDRGASERQIFIAVEDFKNRRRKDIDAYLAYQDSQDRKDDALSFAERVDQGIASVKKGVSNLIPGVTAEPPTRQELAKQDYDKAKADQAKRFADYEKRDADALIADNQQDGNALTDSAVRVGTDGATDQDTEAMISSLFGRSYKPMDEGALAMINLGAGIAKGDISAGLTGAVTAIGDERDRRRKERLSEAQAQYYLSAGDRASKDSYLDMYRRAATDVKEMGFDKKKVLLTQILGREPTREELSDPALQDKMIQLLAMQYAEMEQISAKTLANLSPDQTARNRATPRNPVSDARLMQYGNSLIGT